MYVIEISVYLQLKPANGVLVINRPNLGVSSWLITYNKKVWLVNRALPDVTNMTSRYFVYAKVSYPRSSIQTTVIVSMMATSLEEAPTTPEVSPSTEGATAACLTSNGEDLIGLFNETVAENSATFVIFYRGVW